MERKLKLGPGPDVPAAADAGADAPRTGAAQAGLAAVADSAAFGFPDARGGAGSVAGPGEAEADGADSCIICGARGAEGIRICEQLICDACEREMVRTEAGDARYAYFVGRMRKILDRICDD